MYGVSPLLDLAARDAVRAGGSTSSATAGLQAAQQACLAHRGDGYWVSNPTIAGGALATDAFNNSTATDFTYTTNPGLTTPSPSGSPWLSATARCTILAPFAPGYGGSSMGGGAIAYSRTYVGPILGTPFNLFQRQRRRHHLSHRRLRHRLSHRRLRHPPKPPPAPPPPPPPKPPPAPPPPPPRVHRRLRLRRRRLLRLSHHHHHHRRCRRRRLHRLQRHHLVRCRLHRLRHQLLIWMVKDSYNPDKGTSLS